MNRPSIAIIGPGRAGSALAYALDNAGYTIAAVHDRHPEHAQRLADALHARVTNTAAGAIDLAELTALAVPDGQVAPLARDIAEYQCSSAGKAVVHVSGASDRAALAPLRVAGLRTGVFHPLQALITRATPAQLLPGTLYGIDADPPLRATLEQMARDLGGEPFDLQGIDRARYHAAAVLVSNFPVTLFHEACTLMEEAGIVPAQARRGLLALLQGTLTNLTHESPQEALTGPAARGDAATIESHLKGLRSDPELQQLYRLLSDRTTRLAQSRHGQPSSPLEPSHRTSTSEAT